MRKIQKKGKEKNKNFVDRKLEMFSEFVNKQKWIVYVFALIGAGFVLFISISVFAGYSSILLKEYLQKTITIENARADFDARQDSENDPSEGIKSSSSSNDKEVGPEEIIQEIKRVFVEDPDTAVEFAKCESLFDPTRIGDKHLIFEHEGELIGHSIGVFQIRTGGREKNGLVWNRAKANGMSVEEFVELMKDPFENIKYGHEIFQKSGGWGPWKNCAIKLGVL